MKGVNLPLTADKVVEDLKHQINELQKIVSATEKQILARLHEQFIADGGCEKCHGRGWRVTWDTMDSMSGCYAEYGPCEAGEACTAKVTGPDFSVERSKYDDNRGVPTYVFELDPAWIAAAKPMVNIIKELEARILRTKTKPVKGDKVVIVKGTKAPVGFVGTLFWTGMTKHGERCGIKTVDAAGKEDVQWTYPTNIALVYNEGK